MEESARASGGRGAVGSSAAGGAAGQPVGLAAATGVAPVASFSFGWCPLSLLQRRGKERKGKGKRASFDIGDQVFPDTR